MLNADHTSTLPKIVALEPSVYRVRNFAQWAHGRELIYDLPALDYLDDVAVAASEYEGSPTSLVAIIKAAYLHRLPRVSDVRPRVSFTALEELFSGRQDAGLPGPVALVHAITFEFGPLADPDPHRNLLNSWTRIANGGLPALCLSLCERYTTAMYANMKRAPAYVMERLRLEHPQYRAILRVPGQLDRLWTALEEAMEPKRAEA